MTRFAHSPSTVSVRLAAVFIGLAGFAGLAAAQPAAGPARAVATEKLATDPGWPREVTKDGIKFIYYEPQIEEWKNQRDLRARIAFTLTPAKGDSIVGVAELQGNTVADLEHRTVFIDPLTFTSVRFPGLPDDQEAEMSAKVKALFPPKVMTVSLDRLLALASESTAEAKPVKLQAEPPVIFSSPDPAILLAVDGKPVLAPIEGTDLQFVVNTTWDVFFCTGDSQYYLVTERGWLTSSALDGKWTVAVKLPDGFKKLPKDEQWDHVRKTLPPKVTKSVPPKVFFSEKPAELIAFAGQPVFKAIDGTSLLFATNTESWVFFSKKDGQLYFLTAGRWFKAAKYDGPWTYAGNDLPADFAKIPQNSEAAEVLASVPGTPEAADAILLAQIPTTARVDRKKAVEEMKLAYDGKPEFKPIEGTSMQYATNASGGDVIQLGDKYYACVNAVWFVANTPEGPWEVATTVPPELYQIPPESPVYNTTYVTVDSATDEYVETSYTDGYLGSYVAGVGLGAALWWGTGWYYPPYVYWGGGYPIYHPYWRTYGRGAYYNPLTGGYAVGGYAYGPYGAAGRAAWYNPATGRYGRAATVQGPYGSRSAAGFYNPSTGAAGVTRQGSGPYGQWGSTTVKRGSDTIHTSHIKGSEGGMIHGSGPNGTGTVAKYGGNVYAGKDGNVYKRDSAGNWTPVNGANTKTKTAAQNRAAVQNAAARQPAATQNLAANRAGNINQRPSAAQRPTGDTLNGLNREAAARQRGTQNVQRTQNYNTYNRNSFSSSSVNRSSSNFGGYHPGASTGAYRGGGGGAYRGGGGGGYRGGGGGRGGGRR